jgi:hypothetical protein
MKRFWSSGNKRTSKKLTAHIVRLTHAFNLLVRYSPRLTFVSKHLLTEGKNFLHGGGRAAPNGPMAAERLLKLFIFL